MGTPRRRSWPSGSYASKNTFASRPPLSRFSKAGSTSLSIRQPCRSQRSTWRGTSAPAVDLERHAGRQQDPQRQDDQQTNVGRPRDRADRDRHDRPALAVGLLLLHLAYFRSLLAAAAARTQSWNCALGHLELGRSLARTRGRRLRGRRLFGRLLALLGEDARRAEAERRKQRDGGEPAGQPAERKTPPASVRRLSNASWRECRQGVCAGPVGFSRLRRFYASPATTELGSLFFGWPVVRVAAQAKGFSFCRHRLVVASARVNVARWLGPATSTAISKAAAPRDAACRAWRPGFFLALASGRLAQSQLEAAAEPGERGLDPADVRAVIEAQQPAHRALADRRAGGRGRPWSCRSRASVASARAWPRSTPAG